MSEFSSKHIIFLRKILTLSCLIVLSKQNVLKESEDKERKEKYKMYQFLPWY